jgi:hypothetical protein
VLLLTYEHWDTISAPEKFKHIQEFTFIQDHFKGDRKRWRIFGWMVYFLDITFDNT